MKPINKIIYFDKETIRNILQEQDKGSKTTQTGMSASASAGANLEVGAKVKLSVPLIDRLGFLFSGELRSSFMVSRDSETTITSTEISQFEELKSRLLTIEDVVVGDIENSSTFFRVAGGYMRFVKGDIEGVDTKEFKTVMDGYDGYDTYKIDDCRYVRFNNAAFVSNYKRNDLLITKMTLVCIKVGRFPKEKFDFMKQVSKMEALLTGVTQYKTLADAHPPEQPANVNPEIDPGDEPWHSPLRPDTYEVSLFDVLYACISSGVGGNQ